MRLKITLEIVPQALGTVLPISYQCQLSQTVDQLLKADMQSFASWLSDNGFTPEDNTRYQLYSISNLYVPRIYVQGDRLQINVPRVQFWLSFYPESGTRELVTNALIGKSMDIGDQISRVRFLITAVDLVSPVKYSQVMEYQTLSPVVVQGVRPNRSMEYLFPQNPCFSEFFVQDLIERWEHIHRMPYTGSRSYKFQSLRADKRKAVSCWNGTPQQRKIIGYMLKFRLTIDPKLQEIAYVCGLGDCIHLGFGYLELLQKSAD